MLVASVPCTLASAFCGPWPAATCDRSFGHPGDNVLAGGQPLLALSLDQHENHRPRDADDVRPRAHVDLARDCRATLAKNPPCKTFTDRFKTPISIFAQLFGLAIILKAGVGVGDKLHDENTTAAPLIFLSSVLLAVSLHLFALASGWFSCGWLGFDRGRQIAVAFSASQKTLQISIMLFDEYYRERYPYAIMPLLFYHVGQLLFDTAIAKRIAKNGPDTPPPDDLEASA